MSISPHWKIDPVTGNLSSPTSKEIDVAAQPTIAGDSLLVNQNAGTGRPTALAIAAQSLILRLADRIQSFAMATNTVLMRGAADITALAMGTQSVLIRAAGNIIAQAIGTNEVLGRQGSGNLGPVKVTPNMLAPIARTLLIGTAGFSNSVNATITADVTVGTWAAISSNGQAVPEAGVYRVIGYLHGTSSSVAANYQPALVALVNGAGSNLIAAGVRESSSAAMPISIAPSPRLLTLAAGDILTFRLNVADTFTPNATTCYILIEKVSP